MAVETASVVIGVALLASLAQGVTAFGFALISVPFLVLVLDVKDTVVVVSVKDNWGNDYERASGWNSLDGEPRSTPRMRPGQSSPT